MASVFKRCRTAPLPAGAKISENTRAIPKAATIADGIASWTDRRGVTIGGLVTSDGRRVVMKDLTWEVDGKIRTALIVPQGGRIIDSIDRCYSAKFRDANGKWVRKSTGTSDRDAAKQIASKWEADSRRRRTGVIDAVDESLADHASKPIADQLDAFIKTRATKGGTEEHRVRTRRQIEEFVDAKGWQTIGDIKSDDVADHVESLKAAGSAARTIQSKLQAIKSFTKWLADHHRLRMNPLSMIGKPDPKSDRRHERRMILPDEWPWIAAALNAADSLLNGMLPAERLLLYQAAIQTGLRATEIHELTRSKLIVTRGTPHVLCKAAGTKNRKPAKQFIDPGLATSLAEHCKTKHPTAPVFAIGSKEELSRTIEADLADARRLWLKSLDDNQSAEAESSDFLMRTNHDGEHLVFHSLRHTCGAWLALAGEHVKTVQIVMRHGSITLTMDTYGHLFPGQAEDAPVKLAAILAGNSMGTILGTNPTA